MSLHILKQLESALTGCMCADRHRLRRELNALQSLGRQGQAGVPGFQKRLGFLEEKIKSSQLLAQMRRASLPQVDYPPQLPVSKRMDDLRAALQNNQVIIVAGETGSGKTTQLPKLCLESGRGVYGMIGHTQPRRLAATSVAARLTEELGAQSGGQVGFQIRFSDTSTEKTLIKLMTDGILLAETQHDRWLDRYDTIIIDEAHERSLNIDFLLGYLKRLLPRRPDLKVIITSATIDVQSFSAHFNNAPVIEVSGRTWPVEHIYMPPDEQEQEGDLSRQVLGAIEEIFRLERKHKQDYRDVLVFLSGEKEIRDVAELLRKQQIPGLEVLPLYARLSAREQQRVFASHPGRRIVLSTNVAETSLTVPGIGYVIDSGLVRLSRYSVRSKIQRLPIEPVSKASANQRAGRCGRLGPGTCIRLYSEQDFQGRADFTDTEITRTNLASVILQMLSLKLGNIDDFPFLEVPEPRAIRDGFRLLEELQAVDAKGQLLPRGRIMARFPVDPRLSRILVEAAEKHCLTEALIIVSALSTQDPRERPHDKQQAADQAHRLHHHPESDFMGFVNLWTHYESQRQTLGSNQLRRYCQQHFLSWLRMREWREVHRQLLLMCQELKLPLNRDPATYEEIHQALLSGFLSQVSRRLDEGGYLGARARKYQIFPGSVLHRKKQPWILSAELVETSQLYARMNASIEPQWIERQARHLIKFEYADPHWEKTRGQVMASEKVLLYGLAIVEKRRVSYTRVDPLVCRELLIREGLAAMDINTRAAFFLANCHTISRLAELEEKTRRRDLVMDERRIASFYDERLPATVVDVASLERWYKGLPKEEAARLLLTDEDLLSEEAGSVDLNQYPRSLEANGLALDLSYSFSPGEEQDGVSAEVPVQVLKQLRQEDLDWLVPGLLREKCIALIRALPRQLRKHFVPVPDVVDRILPQLNQQDGSLRQSLARQLLRHSGVKLDPAIWDEVQLPPHLSMHMRVVDDRGRVLGSGRELEQLRDELGASVQASITRAGSGNFERKGLKEWDFDELPAVHEIGAGKLQIRAYPALVDKGDSADLVLLDSAYKAELASRQGMVRLLMLAGNQQVRYLKKELLKNPGKVLLLGSMEASDKLPGQIIMRAFAIACRIEEELPRTREDWDSRWESCKNRIISAAMELQELLYEILELRQQMIKILNNGGNNPQFAELKADVLQHLDALLGPDFILETPVKGLRQMPKYLRAVLCRLEKFPLQTAKDREWTRLLGRLWDQYNDRRQYFEKQEIASEKLDAYRWLLEEFRVSLFAQHLGTSVPVSEKRLQKAWQEIN